LMSHRRESAPVRLAFFIRRRRLWAEGGLVVFLQACVEERWDKWVNGQRGKGVERL
jgi:hypothetical protein